MVSSLPTKYPEREYEYSFTRVDSKGQAKAMEEELLKTYLKQFGELPPLNSVLPNRYDSQSNPITPADEGLNRP